VGFADGRGGLVQKNPAGHSQYAHEAVLSWPPVSASFARTVSSATASVFPKPVSFHAAL